MGPIYFSQLKTVEVCERPFTDGSMVSKIGAVVSEIGNIFLKKAKIS